jgi:hypothetical protein
MGRKQSVNADLMDRSIASLEEELIYTRIFEIGAIGEMVK